MAKLNEWNVEVKQTYHTIGYKAGGFSSKLYIDGNEISKLKSQNIALNLIDYPVKIDDKIFNLVVIGNKADLAVDGVFINSEEPYSPIKNIPNWINVMSGIIFIAGFPISGILGGVIGFLGASLCIQKSIKENYNICVLIAIATVILEILLMFFYAFLLY